MSQSLGGCLESFSVVFQSSPNSAAQGPLEQQKGGGGGDHLPFSAGIGKAAELPRGLRTTWIIPKPHQSSFAETGLVPKCKNTSEKVWKLQLHNASHLTQGISFKLCKGILATSLDGHSPGKYTCTQPLAPKADALPSSGAPGMFFSFHCPFSSCQQKALPWQAKFTGCNDRAAQDHLGTAEKKLMLPFKYQSHYSKVIPLAKPLVIGLL